MRDHSHSSGRSSVDHPDTVRQHRAEVARLEVKERARHLREAQDDERLAVAAVACDGQDTFDRAERDYQRMEAEEVGQPHPNEWVHG